MIVIKATFDDGDSFITKINATPDEARKYYVGNIFNMGCEKDELRRCINIEIIEE